jgi:integrase
MSTHGPLRKSLQLVRSSNEKRSVRARRRLPARPSNSELRPREYLTPSGVETLIKTARQGRHGHRDATLILVAYWHGLRAAEICDLEWSQVEFDRAATLHTSSRARSCTSDTTAVRRLIIGLLSFFLWDFFLWDFQALDCQR